jgi:hypothetical protein
VTWLSAYALRTGSLLLAGIHCLSEEKSADEKRKLMKTAERKVKKQEYDEDI